MIQIKKVSIHKYKCFSETQEFDVEKDITALVGMNEAGKSALLEAIAKTNYLIDDDDDFTFDTSLDYPRKEKKRFDKSGDAGLILSITYEISDDLIEQIQEDLGQKTFTSKEFIRNYYYDKEMIDIDGLEANIKAFIEFKIDSSELDGDNLIEELKKISDKESLNKLKNNPDYEANRDFLNELTSYMKNENFENPLEGYVWNKWIEPSMPKYLYYSEYYNLPSEINIHNIPSGLSDKEEKTARALFELADVNLDELKQNKNYEGFISELEATANLITETLFKYWTQNKNLNIKFDIRDKHDAQNQPYKLLIIRIENTNYKMTLPLKNRSKGFNWFFSFIVWFSKIQEDKESNYTILLDEPGLHLHAKAQADLLDFLNDLCSDYQVLYTTHSPFMIETEHLNRVRTIFETENGAKISDSIQEKDPNTLFPLQAALGYDIAQNLFISPKNLLVEGVSDLMYLTGFSEHLKSISRTGLSDDITIVPVGGMEKVATFISLLRGSRLKIACLLDTISDQSAKEKLNNMVKNKLIQMNKIIYYQKFILNGSNHADVEDLFKKEEYLKLFNSSRPKETDISISDLDVNIKPMIIQLNKYLNQNRFNHYSPANAFIQRGIKEGDYSEETLNRFEKVFETVNGLFKK